MPRAAVGERGHHQLAFFLHPQHRVEARLLNACVIKPDEQSMPVHATRRLKIMAVVLEQGASTQGNKAEALEIMALAQGEQRAVLPAANAQLIAEGSDIEPGREALLDARHHSLGAPASELRPQQAAAAKPHLNPLGRLQAELSFNGHASSGQRWRQPQQVHAAALAGHQHLQILKPGLHLQIGLLRAAPTQLPHTLKLLLLLSIAEINAPTQLGSFESS